MFHVGSRKDHFWLIQFSIFPFSLLSSALEWTAFLTLVCQSVSILYWCRCKFNYRLQRSSIVGFHITWRPRTWFTVMLLFSSYTFFVYFILFIRLCCFTLVHGHVSQTIILMQDSLSTFFYSCILYYFLLWISYATITGIFLCYWHYVGLILELP
jgi:hypothetical protein